MARIAVQAGEILQVAGVGQLIEVDDRFIRLAQPVEDEISADETGTTGDENAHVRRR